MADSRFRRTAGGVSSLVLLPVVWCPRYRRRLPGGRVAVRLGALLERIAAENRWVIVAREVVPDNGHLFLRVRPVDAPGRVVRRLTGRTARMLPRECAWRADSEVLWSPPDCAAPVAAAPVRRDVEYRWGAVA